MLEDEEDNAPAPCIDDAEPPQTKDPLPPIKVATGKMQSDDDVDPMKP